MPLTPTDVRNVAFSKPPIGKRGYHDDEVDAFLDLVGAEIARLVEENQDLRNQVERLDRQLGAVQTSAGSDHQVQAAKVLGMAQEIADRLTGDAKAEADGMVSQARTRSAQLLAEARTKTDDMINEASTRAEALDRQSREKADSLERDAAHKHAEIIGSISQEKSRLEQKIDELRTVERDYRTHLKTYLQSQLRELDWRGSTTPAATTAVRSSARNGPPDEGISDEPDTSEIRWKPAVERGDVGVRGVIEPWERVQRSVS